MAFRLWHRGCFLHRGRSLHAPPVRSGPMRVLLATDGSSYAREAARFLNNLLHHEVAAQIDVVAVRPTAMSGDGMIRPRARGFHPVAAELPGCSTPEDWLLEARRELTNPGLTIESVELSGDPVRLVVERSVSIRYDLVVAGAKGCGATPFFELGTVARALLQDSPASTLLVRKGGGGYAREFSTPSGHRPARALIASAGPAASPGSDPTPEWPLLASFALDSGEIPVVPCLPGHGYQPREVDREARRGEVDLLIIDGRGPDDATGISSSAARTTVWTAPCSTLLLRDGRRRTPTSSPALRRASPPRATQRSRSVRELQS
ncbi:MAG: universal stress protein [Gemmatimonadales bacterium]|nr:MAG: universal stress protein [Gemmatimonadales bacterium]